MKNTFVILAFMLFALAVKAQKDTLSIIFLHTNDMHSNIDRIPYVAHQINQIKAQNQYVYLVSAGDVFTGNPVVDKHSDPGFYMIELMNKMGYIVSAVGNHEFDYGQEIFQKRRQQANFPFICANINTTQNNILSPISPLFKLTVADTVKVGFLGLIHREDNLLPASHPSKLSNLTFDDPIKTAKKYKNYRDSFDIFICLSHCGIEIDEPLARKVKFFDAIIGGHSHTVILNGKKVNKTLIVQAGSKFSYIGVLTIKYLNNRIVSISDSLILVKNIKNTDTILCNLINEYNHRSGLEYTIGYNEAELNDKQEIGALITTAMLDTTGADIAFQNIGGIRKSELPQGDITYKQILELQPFGNTLFVVDLNLKQMKQLIKYSYNISKENEIVVGGAKVKIFVGKNKKIKNIELYDINGNPLQKKTYKVVVNDYMATAYKLDFFKKGTNTYINDAETTTNYIKKHKSINFSKVKNVEIIEK